MHCFQGLVLVFLVPPASSFQPLQIPMRPPLNKTFRLTECQVHRPIVAEDDPPICFAETQPSIVLHALDGTFCNIDLAGTTREQQLTRKILSAQFEPPNWPISRHSNPQPNVERSASLSALHCGWHIDQQAIAVATCYWVSCLPCCAALVAKALRLHMRRQWRQHCLEPM